LALRTQQIIGFESGVVDTVDPLAGSYFVESLTNDIERRARDYIAQIDERGGSVAAIEAGFLQSEIEAAAYEAAKAVERGDQVVVGVNRFTEDGAASAVVFPIDAAQQRLQVERVGLFKSRRDDGAVGAALENLTAAARGTANLLYPMKDALAAGATLGEVADTLREEFGEYGPG
ncbi:MAG: methylmalonyl-CoA mutase, partial [Acidobacteriota bacterium]|nr:methylmalonyl-CoA mutase [Acidobacteriota bacterium]